MARKYRNGPQQQDTLRALLAKLDQHETKELRDMVATALAAEVPAQVLADAVGISYSGLLVWIDDGTQTTRRTHMLPRINAVAAGMSIGMRVGLLPSPDANSLGPLLAILVRCVELKRERDSALQDVSVMKAYLAAAGKGVVSQETADTYVPDEA